MRVLDLFSGIGGFSLGLERAGMQTVAFCEIEEYPRKVLAKHWPDVLIFDDVRALTAEKLKDAGITVDVICGGYPCQPFSTAGKRGGQEDDRHLWPEMYRIIKDVRPRWVLAENVAGHISMGLDDVLSDLEAENYAWWTFVIPACAVDAKHRRDRVWIVANNEERANGAHNTEQIERQKQEPGKSVSRADVANAKGKQSGGRFCGDKQGQGTITGNNRKAMADSIQKGLEGHARNEQDRHKSGRHNANAAGSIAEGGICSGERAIWKPEPAVGRVANGIPRRVDRLKCLGNAVVPKIPEIIGRAIMVCEGWN